MTLKKFKNKTKRKTTEELTVSLIDLNYQYYTALKYYISNKNKPSKEDEKFLITLQKKIEYTSESLKIKFELQNIHKKKQNCPWSHGHVVKTEETLMRRS